MSAPKVTHVSDMGKTTDHNSVAVKVERTAYLDESLTTVVDRTDGRIHLLVREGYADVKSLHLPVDQVGRLVDALMRALSDVSSAESHNATRGGDS